MRYLYYLYMCTVHHNFARPSSIQVHMYRCTVLPPVPGTTRYHYKFKIGVPNFAFFLPFFLSSSTFFDEPCSFTSLVFLVFRRLASFLPSSVVGALCTPMHVGYALRWRFLFFPIPPDSTKSCTPTPSFLWKNVSIQLINRGLCGAYGLQERDRIFFYRRHISVASPRQILTSSLVTISM